MNYFTKRSGARENNHENKFRHQKPFCHHHGRRARRTVLAVEPRENTQATAPAARQTFVSPAGRVDRVLPLVPAKNIFVITNEAQLPEVRKQLPKILKANLIASSSDAVVAGSAVVNQIASHGRSCDLVPQVSRFVRSLKTGG